MLLLLFLIRRKEHLSAKKDSWAVDQFSEGTAHVTPGKHGNLFKQSQINSVSRWIFFGGNVKLPVQSHLLHAQLNSLQNKSDDRNISKAHVVISRCFHWMLWKVDKL